MSKGGGGSSYPMPTITSSNSGTSTKIPSWLTNASQYGIGAATNLMNAGTPSYNGDLVPGMSADQTAAGDMIRNGIGDYQGYYDQASGLTNAATQQGPQVAAQTYQNSLQNVGDYMNPYIGNVIGGLRQAAAENLAGSLTRTGDQAIGAKAFGSSRHGVQEGVATAGVNNALNNQIGQLMSGGYNQATNLMGQDISNNFAAQQANQNAYSNYMNRLLGAGSQMSNIGTANRAANVADINNLLQYGNMQQDTATRQAQAAYNNWQWQQNYPFLALQAYNNTVQGAPHSTSGTANTMSVGYAPQQQSTSSPLMGGLSGAMSGAYMGNMLLPGGLGAGIGAVGGGLLGAFS